MKNERAPGGLSRDRALSQRQARRRRRACAAISRNAAIRCGKPAVMVHGGPGGGSNATMRRFHDPARYRIVLFDQRGGGKSTPARRARRANTTWAPRRRHGAAAPASRHRALAAVRRLLGLDAGARLCPDAIPSGSASWCCAASSRCAASELDWFYQEGAARLFPDAWEEYRERRSRRAERGDMIAAYYRRLTGADPAERLRRRPRLEPVGGRDDLAAARSGAGGARSAPTSSPSPSPASSATISCMAASSSATTSCIERRRHGCRTSPASSCMAATTCARRLANAWDLKRAWPEADLRIVDDAGHAMTEPGTIHELVSATDAFRD